MPRQNPIIRRQLNEWHLKRAPFPAVPFVNYFSEDPLINGSVFAKDLREREIEQIRHDLLAEGFPDVKPWDWIWARRRSLGHSIGMGKTALLTYICDRINKDFGQSFFNRAANWLALYVPVLSGTKSLEQIAAYALASLCNESRGLSTEHRLLARLRRRVIVQNQGSSYPANLSSISVFQFLKGEWLVERGISRLALDADVEQLLLRHRVSAPVARAFATGNLRSHLASLNGDAHLIPVSAGLRNAALGILLNDVANIAQAATISKVTVFLDDFYFAVSALTPAERVPFAARIRSMAVDGPYESGRNGLFNWIAVMHTVTAPRFSAAWETANMEVIASLQRNENTSVTLRGFTEEQGRELLREYLRYRPNRLTRAPSEIYPFTTEALDAIVHAIRQKDPSVGDPSIPPRTLMQLANDVVHHALKEQARIPIGPEFVAHVVNGTPLPPSSDDDEMEEADTEEPQPFIACPCGCHDESAGEVFDVMAVIAGSGSGRQAVRHYCQNCNEAITVEARSV